FGADDQTLAGTVVKALDARDRTVAVAESCTGGWLGKLLVDVPGASDVLAGGVIGYANAVKEDLLGVPCDLLTAHGAVSEPVAAAMAQGVRRRLGADYALAITGVAGPTGGTADKPVGLVYTALAWDDGQTVRRNQFAGARQAVRLRSALTALNMLRLHLLDP
ncbi:MAG: nicotinamide-nucleotide amidohydrolase family protein, partial [Planctomycetota bacterium]